MNSTPIFPRIGHGIGLRTKHWSQILEQKPQVDWFEIVSENFMDSEGKTFRTLEKIRSDYPIVAHGVSLSIGSADPVNPRYLEKLKSLVDRIDPVWFSDHLCWTGVNQQQSYDLLPLPQTQEAVEHIVNKINLVQDYIGRKMLIENVSSYVTFKESEMSEWEFLSQIAKKAGCGILLDINNVYVNSFNHGFSAEDYINAIPQNLVGQFHLAGHTRYETYLFDTHSARMTEPVWDLYRVAVQRFGKVPTLVEWDEKIPEFEVLLDERRRAMEIEKSATA